MAFVDIPLSRYIYRFRSLTFRESFACEPKEGEDVRRNVLIKALVSISGTTPTSVDASKIIYELSTPILDRMWLLYLDGLPKSRSFTTERIFSAPDVKRIHQVAAEDDEKQEGIADRAASALRRRFGGEDVDHTLAQEQKILTDAHIRGTLSRSTDAK
jgi:hypothetical protein